MPRWYNGRVRHVCLALLLASCVSDQGFVCHTSPECGMGGSCQATGFCSVSDSTCPSGSRYVAHAGAYSDQCVMTGPDSAVGLADAMPGQPDSPPGQPDARPGQPDARPGQPDAPSTGGTPDAFVADSMPGQPDAMRADAGTSVANSCNGFHLLVDNMDNGQTEIWDRNSYTYSEGTHSEAGGKFSIGLSGPNYDGGGGYVTFRTFTLYEDAIFVEVPSVFSTTSNGETFFQVDLDNQNEIWMYESHGSMTFGFTDNGTDTDAGNITYSASAHKWWRMREHAGKLYWDTSPDGTTWTNRASHADPSFDLSQLLGDLNAATTGTNPSDPGTASFDNLDVGAAATPGYCATASFTDDFSSASPVHEWNDDSYYAGGACSGGQAAGTAKITVNDTSGNGAECAYVSSDGFSLLGSNAKMQNTQMVSSGASSQAYAFFVLADDADDELQFFEYQGTIYFRWRLGTDAPLTYQIAGQMAWNTNLAYWRFTDAGGGTVIWETSPDSINWTTRASKHITFPLTEFQVTFGAGVNSGGPETVIFDNYNLPG
jgi:hypothetical protein